VPVEKSYPPKKNTISTPIPKVDSVHPASQAIEFEGRSDASMRITATIAQGESAQTMASGRISRKRAVIRRACHIAAGAASCRSDDGPGAAIA
jgi:hypothetical protein